MVNPKLSSHKLVLPASLYHKRVRIPESWNDVLRDANYSILFSGRTGCLAGDTEVWTSDGMIPIKDCPDYFKVKSYSFGYDKPEFSFAKKVVSGNKQVFRLNLSGGQDVVCSSDHIFFCATNCGTLESKLSDLRPGQPVFVLGVDSQLCNVMVESLTPLGVVPTYDLQVLGNNNFFLANGILTHNSGKDSLTTYVMNIDLAHNRTCIVLDTKMEYPCGIFCQQDVVLRNILLKNGLVGRGYKVVLWIPFVEGLDRNEHFRELLTYHHPNLEIRPYRIRIQDFASDDSYNMALAKTQLQASADKSKLSGSSRMTNEAREDMGRRMGFDDQDLWGPGCGWEYVDFDELSNNKKINVISTFFLSKNSITATSYMMGVMNDLITIGKSINRVRGPNELFTITIPEVEILLPRNVKSLDQVVNTLRFSMRMGLKLMRSFGVRFRMNLQNLSALDSDMVSQSVPFAGKTWNPKDLNMLGIFGLSRKERVLISKSAVGQFRDVIHGKDFSAVPFSHKAREMEFFVTMMRQYYADPSLFLFETENYFLSEILDYQEFFWEGKPLTVKEYNRRVRSWLKAREKREIQPINRLKGQDIGVFEEALDMLEGVPM